MGSVSSMISGEECVRGERLIQGEKVNSNRVIVLNKRELKVGSIFEEGDWINEFDRAIDESEGI